MSSLWRRLFITSLATVALLAAKPLVAHAQYGQNVYGGCDFGMTCTSANPPTVIEVPPSADNQAPGRVFAVNITENQVFRSPSYGVEITPNFSTDAIMVVKLLVDGVVVGQVLEADEQGVYRINLKLSANGSRVIRVEMELKDGHVINREFNVQVFLGDSPPGGISNNGFSSGGTAASTTGVQLQIPGSIEGLIHQTPKPIAYAMPYFLLSLLGILALTLLWQARNQMSHVKVLLALLKRDKELADEKTNFVMLASHYMRTPITVINGSLEIVPKDQQTIQFVEQVQLNTRMLQQRFEVILKETTESKDIADIEAPDVIQIKKRLILSWRIVGPVALTAILIVATNVLFITGQRIRLIIPNIVTQVVLWLVLTYVVLVYWQRQQNARQEAYAVVAQRRKEQALDQARNTFIRRAADELRPHVVRASEASLGLPKDSNTKRIQASIQQLNSTIDRFALTSLLERGKIQSNISSFDIEKMIEAEFAGFEPVLQEKSFAVDSQVDSLRLAQHYQLIRYVLHDILDNAIKHTPAGGRITLRTKYPSQTRVLLRVRNYGVGMTEEQMSKLFRPFSRAASGVSFQDEGIGLGLYLSRLIMRYLDGDLYIESTSAKSTLAQLDIPTSLNTQDTQ